MKVLTIAKKNLTRLFRKRVPLLTLVIGPMALVLLVGLAFSGTGEFAVTVGVFSEDYSPLTASLLGKLEERGYAVQKEPMLDACIDSVKQRITNICVVFPKNIGSAGSEIEFHADYSEVGLVHPILETIASTVSATGDEISAELTNDILNKLSSAEEEINTKVPIIVKLFTQNDKLRGQTETIIEQLNGIDLSVNVAEMRSEEIASQFQALHAITVATIIDANNLIVNLEDGMNRLSISDAGLNSELHSASVEFEKHRRSLETSQTEINAIMGSVEGVVGAAAAKLSDAKMAKRSAAKTSAEIRDTLSETLHELNVLQASLNNIKKSVTSIEIKDAATIVNPITTKITPISDKKTHFNYLFPTLVMIILMITSVLLGATMIVEEKNSAEFFRTAISPTSESTFLFGAVLSALAVVMVQTSIFMLIASIFFDVSLFLSFPTTALSLIILSLVFITLGILIGAIFRERESATLSAIILSMLFLLFSGVLLPLEGMTEIMRAIAMLNPLVIGQRLLAQSIFFGFSLADVGMTLLKLAGITSLIFITSAQVSLRMRTKNMAHIKYGNIDELRSKWNAHAEIWLEKVEPALANFNPLSVFSKFTGRRTPRPATYFDDSKDDDIKEFNVMDAEEAALLAETKNPEDDPRCKEIDAELSRLQNELKKLG